MTFYSLVVLTEFIQFPNWFQLFGHQSCGKDTTYSLTLQKPVFIFEKTCGHVNFKKHLMLIIEMKYEEFTEYGLNS